MEYERLYEVTRVEEINNETTEIALKLIGGPATPLRPVRGFGEREIVFQLPRKFALAYNVGSFFRLRVAESGK